MPIFTQSLQKIDSANPADAIKKMANHIKYIQEQLEYTLMNLDSRNIVELDTDKTVISDSTGSVNIGSYVGIAGQDGESFVVGRNNEGQFEFALKGKGGMQMIYLNNDGEIVITKRSNLDIDGGEW